MLWLSPFGFPHLSRDDWTGLTCIYYTSSLRIDQRAGFGSSRSDRYFCCNSGTNATIQTCEICCKFRRVPSCLRYVAAGWLVTADHVYTLDISTVVFVTSATFGVGYVVICLCLRPWCMLVRWFKKVMGVVSWNLGWRLGLGLGLVDTYARRKVQTQILGVHVYPS